MSTLNPTDTNVLDKVMQAKLEAFYAVHTLAHLDLNGLLCGVNPDSPDMTGFHSVLIGTSSMTLKEEYSSFVYTNLDKTSPVQYCRVCLKAFAQKLT